MSLMLAFVTVVEQAIHMQIQVPTSCSQCKINKYLFVLIFIHGPEMPRGRLQQSYTVARQSFMILTALFKIFSQWFFASAKMIFTLIPSKFGDGMSLPNFCLQCLTPHTNVKMPFA